MTEKDRLLSGALYHPDYLYTGSDEENPRFRVQKAQKEFNESEYWHENSALKRLRKCFAQSYDDLVLTPPFFCSYGNRISFGKAVYAECGLTIMDARDVVIGDHVYFGPHVSIYTTQRPLDAFVRSQGLVYSRPVHIGDHVWFAGNTVIKPGVVIADEVVIEAGSVVDADIPGHVLAGGNPCRVIRALTQEDQDKWSLDFDAYRTDEDVIRAKQVQAPQETVFADEMTAEERVHYDRMISGAKQMTLFDLL